MKAYAILQKVTNYDVDEDFSNAWVEGVCFDKDKARAKMHECADDIEKSVLMRTLIAMTLKLISELKLL